jgi:hypothetical protein
MAPNEAATAEQDLRYPIGKWQRLESLTPDQRREMIDQIEATPAHLKAAVAGLTATQLDTPYRPGGWTVRQVVHHIPDSHLNAYTRFKLAATEDEPTVKTYEEGRWAELPDGKTSPIEPSLALLENLHKRWVLFLRSLGPAEWGRKIHHPEIGIMTLDALLSDYAWHGRHHVAHITRLRERNGWK